MRKTIQAQGLLATVYLMLLIEDMLALNDYDVVADAGAMFVGVMKNFVVEVSDGQLTIDFIHVVENPLD